jgi:GNAT superfamily N-acetyltransferase
MIALQAPARAPADLAPEPLQLRAGEHLVVRPVRPQDADAAQVFVRSLSTASRVLRFHVGIRELAPDMLRAMTEVDPRRHVALVVQHGDAIVADARYVLDEGSDATAEFAIAVADEWQGRGLGRHLLARLANHARQRGLVRLYGDVLHDNRRMIALVREAGGRFVSVAGDARVTRAVIDLST